MTIRPRGRGILAALALVFVSAALMRIASLPGVAAGLASAADSARQCLSETDLAALLDTLRAREAKLEQREGALADRAQALGVAEKGMEERLAALRKAEDDLSKTVTFADTAADSDVARLVAIYENMKPREAAPLFETMAPDFAAGFLARMKPETAAAVMASLDPKFAYSVSVIFAGRNAGAPKN